MMSTSRDGCRCKGGNLEVDLQTCCVPGMEKAGCWRVEGPHRPL